MGSSFHSKKKISLEGTFHFKKNLLRGVDMGDGRFKIPPIAPHRPGTLRYNIPLQANLLIDI